MKKYRVYLFFKHETHYVKANNISDAKKKIYKKLQKRSALTAIDKRQIGISDTTL
jgi:hypothetical protein